MAARIILLNGTSSAGKSTLATALRPLLPKTFCYYASDQLADAAFRPLTEPARWEGRETFFSGFHRSIAAFAEAGLDLLVEHIVERASWADQLRKLLHPFDTFWVGVHVPLGVLERRERLRGDRALGEAQEYHRTHDHCAYDIEIENVGTPDMAATQVFQAWSLKRQDDPIPAIRGLFSARRLLPFVHVQSGALTSPGAHPWHGRRPRKRRSMRHTALLTSWYWPSASSR